LLSVAGASLAALAGWGIARAGLAPVGRLAVVAEQVTATGDPSRRVEVDRADELGRLAASFNAMLAALQRSLAAQRQLVSDASHELRTPLTSLRVNAELLAAEPGLPEEERRPQPPGQRGQVQRAGRHGAGAPAGRRADRTRLRTRVASYKRGITGSNPVATTRLYVSLRTVFASGLDIMLKPRAGLAAGP